MAANGITAALLQNEVAVLRQLTARDRTQRTGRGLLMELTGVYEDSRFLWLVSPLYEGGELFDRIIEAWSKGQPYTEVQAAILFEQVLAALGVCHQVGATTRTSHSDIQ